MREGRGRPSPRGEDQQEPGVVLEQLDGPHGADAVASERVEDAAQQPEHQPEGQPQEEDVARREEFGAGRPEQAERAGHRPRQEPAGQRDAPQHQGQPPLLAGRRDARQAAREEFVRPQRQEHGHERDGGDGQGQRGVQGLPQLLRQQARPHRGHQETDSDIAERKEKEVGELPQRIVGWLTGFHARPFHGSKSVPASARNACMPRPDAFPCNRANLFRVVNPGNM